MKKAINKDNKKYLPSLTLSSLKKENILQSFSEQFQVIFTSSSRAVFIRSHFTRTLFDEENVLLKDSIRLRKLNSRRQAYHIALIISTDGKRAYYKSFMISMKKKKRLHRNELSSKSKYYHQILKHFQASDFLRIINVEIQTL